MQLAEEFISAHKLNSIIERCQGRILEGLLHYCLPPRALLSLLSYSTQDHVSRSGNTHNGRVGRGGPGPLPHHTPTNLPTCQPDSIFLCWHSLSSDGPGLCQKLTSSASGREGREEVSKRPDGKRLGASLESRLGGECPLFWWIGGLILFLPKCYLSHLTRQGSTTPRQVCIGNPGSCVRTHVYLPLRWQISLCWVLFMNP